MKVWHVTRTIYGGAGIYAKRLSAALQGVGIDSHVLSQDSPAATGTKGSTAASGWMSGAATRMVRSMSHRLTSAPFHSMLGMESWNGDQIPAPGDIIHFHGMTGWLGYRGLSELIPEGSRVFWTTHDLWPMSGGCILYSGCDKYRTDCGACPVLRTGAKRWAGLELGLKEKFVKKKGILPVANSKWMAKRIEGSRVFRGAKDVAVIPPIIDQAFFASDIVNIRDQLNIAPEKKVLALGARAITDRYKGIPEFLAALANRPHLAGKYVVLLFGEGTLEIPAGLDVRILGRLESAEDLAKVYFSCDAFVSPSAMETFGMALAEAQACGAPVAGFDVGGIRDAISDDCADFLVPTGDFELLLEVVERLVMKRTGSGGRWRMNREWAKEHFEASVCARKQRALYDEALGS